MQDGKKNHKPTNKLSEGHQILKRPRCDNRTDYFDLEFKSV